MQFQVTRGQASPLGVTVDEYGANVAVYSAAAPNVLLCLFDEDDHEIDRITLPFRTGNVHFAHVAGLRAGMRYGFRVNGGVNDPIRGMYANEMKLLIDPYAKLLDRRIRWHQSMSPSGSTIFGAQMYDGVDSAPHTPKSVIVESNAYSWDGDALVKIDPSHRIIYEAHVKGISMQREGVADELKGTYAGLASDDMIAHFKDLGVTSIELLPVFAFFDDEATLRRGLSNYWGYQPISYFAPEPRYAAGGPLAAADELRDAIKALHRAGLEVILDVVYNHTGEGGAEGPSISFRGLDNLTYYQVAEDGHTYVNDAGTGNTFNVANPPVTRLVLDSLRYWITEFHVDGFRFDLASILGRTPQGFNAYNTLLQSMLQDPIINQAVLIAEPWDLGPGGYQLGKFAHPFAEWNDKFRDAVRLAWRRDDLACVHIASRVLGSADRFDHQFRPPLDSVNFVSAHDGMTVRDLVTFSTKHNAANREDNRDGHDENLSDNFGIEGPTDDPKILEARRRRSRAMLATLLVSQGTPMLLAGDEVGNSQDGNNNVYAQDNPMGWVQWTQDDPILLPMVKSAIALRHASPLLRQYTFLHGDMRPRDGMSDVQWFRADGNMPADDDWHDPAWKTLQLIVRGAATDPTLQAVGGAMLVIFALDDTTTTVTLPAWRECAPDDTRQWRLVFDSNAPDRTFVIDSSTFVCQGQAVYVFDSESISPDA